MSEDIIYAVSRGPGYYEDLEGDILPLTPQDRVSIVRHPKAEDPSKADQIGEASRCASNLLLFLKHNTEANRILKFYWGNIDGTEYDIERNKAREAYSKGSKESRSVSLGRCANCLTADLCPFKQGVNSHGFIESVGKTKPDPTPGSPTPKAAVLELLQKQNRLTADSRVIRSADRGLRNAINNSKKKR